MLISRKIVLFMIKYHLHGVYEGTFSYLEAELGSHYFH